MSAVGTFVGLLLAAGNATASNLGLLLQHDATERLQISPRRRSLGQRILRLIRDPGWTIGWGLTTLAGVLQVAALSLAPLSLVQAVLAGGVGVLALVSHYGFGRHLLRREWIGASLSVTGLLMLVTSLGQAATSRDDTRIAIFVPLAIVTATSAAFLLDTSWRRRRAISRPAAGGIAAGLCYGTEAIAIKALVVHIGAQGLSVGSVLSPFLFLLLANAFAGFIILQYAFRYGPPVTSVGLMTVTAFTLPIVAGFAVFGDRLPEDPLPLALRLGAFGLILAGGTSLATAGAASPQRR